MTENICLFHNGNARILAHYREKFSNLKFCGNLAENDDFAKSGCMWEISFADATPDNLFRARQHNVKIIRHISTYEDDQQHLLPECEKFDYDQWLVNAVAKNLCMSDEINSDVALIGNGSETTFITTGRTANSHLQEVFRANGLAVFESVKKIDQAFLDATDAVFIWRLDQWACLASTWISKLSGFRHQLAGKPDLKFTSPIDPIDKSWVKEDWVNICLAVFDQALFSKYVCQRPTTWTTTEYITKQFVSAHQPLRYDKTTLIPDYQNSKTWYEHSGIAEFLDSIYNNVLTHLEPWRCKWAQ